MKYQRTAQKKQTPRYKKFLPWWALIIIAGIAIVLLVLLIPKKQQLTREIEEKPPSEVTLLYVRNLLKRDPNNPTHQLQLIQQLIGLNKFNEAKKRLNEFPQQKPGDKFYWNIQWLHFQYQYQYIFYQMIHASEDKKSESDILNEQTQQMLANQIKKLTDGLNNPIKLSILAQQATFLEQPLLATQIYKKLEKINPIKNPNTLAFYGKIATYGGDYKASAHFYFLAKKYVKDIKIKREYFKDAVVALQQAEGPKLVLQTAIQNLGPLKNDKKTILFIIKFALDSEKPTIAAKYLPKVLYKPEKNKSEEKD